MKKVLILTVTAGEGHNSIANSLSSKLKENPENEVRVLDIFKTYGKPSKPAFINDGYIYACKYALSLYNMFFKMYQKNEPERQYFNLAQTWVNYETPELLKDIYSFKPDVIICAHFYCGIMITNLRKKYEIPAKVVQILFDYTVHPFWECATGVDYFITPTDALNDILIYKGYKAEQLIPLGIPVKQEFSQDLDKFEARKTLGLNLDRFTVMVMMGGGGFGGSEKILKKLLKCKTPLQILIVNGRDEQAKKHIDIIKKSNKTDHVIYNYGFINFVPTMMSATDCIVGKCGGVTVNESLNKRKVLVLPTILAQQEFDNMVFLSNNKCTIIYDDKYNKLQDVIDDVASDPLKLEFLIKNIDKIRKPNALMDICKFALSFDNVTYPDTINITKKDYPKIRHELKRIRIKEFSSVRKEKRAKEKAEKDEEKFQKVQHKDAIKKLKKIKTTK